MNLFVAANSSSVCRINYKNDDAGIHTEMVICDNCGTNAPLGGILVDVMKHIDQTNDIPQKWCLNCVRGTKEERERREQR